MAELQQTKTMPFFARFVLGILVGVLLGFLAEAFFFWDGPFSILGDMTKLSTKTLRTLDSLESFKYLTGPIVGALSLATICCFFGGYEIRGALKTAIMYMLIGTLLGFVIGGYVYPLLRTGGDPNFLSKEMAYYMIQGIFFGVPTGAFGGLFGGIWATWKHAKTAPP